MPRLVPTFRANTRAPPGLDAEGAGRGRQLGTVDAEERVGHPRQLGSAEVWVEVANPKSLADRVPRVEIHQAGPNEAPEDVIAKVLFGQLGQDDQRLGRRRGRSTVGGRALCSTASARARFGARISGVGEVGQRFSHGQRSRARSDAHGAFVDVQVAVRPLGLGADAQHERPGTVGLELLADLADELFDQLARGSPLGTGGVHPVSSRCGSSTSMRSP